MKLLNTVSRMRKVVKSGHWHRIDGFTQQMWETSDIYHHLKRLHLRPFKKRKYYMRKSYFVPYESHRKKGVDYLPF